MSREGECVTLEKGHEGLGIHIRGGTDFPFIKTKDVTDPGIFIVHISDGGYAQRDGRLKVGDKILTINGVDVERVTRHEFVRLFARAAQEEISLNVIHDAAVKILCGDKRGSNTRIKNSMDGDHASSTVIEASHVGRELKRHVPDDQVLKHGDEVGDCPRSGSPSHSLTSRPYDDDDICDLDSAASLVSEGEIPPRPESSLDEAIRNLRNDCDLDAPFELNGRLGKTFLALERVDEVDENIDERCESLPRGSEQPARRDDVDDDDDAATEILLDDLCEGLEGRNSDGSSLNSDSDEELRRCRESVCPESHEVTPRTSPICSSGYDSVSKSTSPTKTGVFTRNLSIVTSPVCPGGVMSPTKTDDSSRASSATPDTVVARSTWMAGRVALLSSAAQLSGGDDAVSLEAENPWPAASTALPQEKVEEDGGEVGSVTVAAASRKVSPSKEATAVATTTTSIEEEEMALGEADRGVEYPSMRVATTQEELMRPASAASAEDIELLRRRLLKRDEDLERRTREEEEEEAASTWFPRTASALCLVGTLALATVLIMKQWKATS